jgi:transposase-like protein
MPDDKELSERQLAVLLALLDERTVAAAARKAGVGRSTVYQWLKEEPLFRQAVGQARAKLFEEALDLLNSGMAKAIEKLLETLDHGSATLRLKAASEIARLGMEMRSTHDIEAKLQELEERADRMLVGRHD